ncbi:hypothetical protein BDQ12DRAFT_719491 [Crucibulum laeve]|uniref:Uncharacterized protein n=1 Tax=Crucibulum laeve TaxID=68775 RepID=A0A5C3MB11_9AGAR|nr:hypothetical protein BDQ12DRAFT_719491 [Crucibulum laeve]
MSLNDTTLIAESARGADIHPGVANPTSVSGGTDPAGANFMKDPTTSEIGAGVDSNFDGHNQARRTFNQTAGVVEGRPGIIESSNIDPLNENSNKDDGWANATSRPTGTAAGAAGPGMVSNAKAMATGAVNMAYGTLMGDEEAKKAGKEAVFGSK